jgi:ferrous iron transport protein A
MNLIAWLTSSKNQLLPSGAAAQAMPEPGLVCTKAVSLAYAPVGQPCRVTAVNPPDAAPEWSRWLAEIGFIQGEPASVRARSPWGDGALVVRIGTSTFALRREEADCIAVQPISL